MRASLQEKSSDGIHENKIIDKQEDLQEQNEETLQKSDSRVSDLLKMVASRPGLQSQQDIDMDQQIEEQEEYEIDKLQQINAVDTIEELRKVFESIRSEKEFVSSKFGKFDSSIWGLGISLKDIDRNLKQEYGKEVIEKLIRQFINNNSLVFQKTQHIGTFEYAKQNVFKEYFDGTYNPADVVADMMRVVSSDKEQKGVPHNYKIINAKLFDWLLDVQYSIQHKNRSVNNEFKSGVNQDISRGAQVFVEDVPYQGYISNMTSQLNRLYNQRVVLENEKRNEIILLNRRYPSAQKRNFISFFTRRKAASKMLDLDKETEFSYEDLNMPWGERVTHEDKMYAMVDIFYNRKMKAINDEERQLIKKKKAEFREDKYRDSLKEIKKDIGVNFNSDIMFPMQMVKRWNDYSPDIRVHKSLVMGSKEKMLEFLQSSTIESVLSGVAIKARRLIGDVTGEDIIKNINPKRDKPSIRSIKIKKKYSPYGLLGLIPSIEKQSTDLATITRRDIVKKQNV